MKAIMSIKQLTTWAVLLLVVILSLTSCKSIYDVEGDCSVEYRVKFRNDYNLSYADAFSHDVRSITVYAFDDNGTFVYQRTEQGDMLGEIDYSMLMEVMPGDYHLIAWAGLAGEESFSVPILTPGVSSIEDLTCKMNRISKRSSDGSSIVNEDLKPLWHGEMIKQSFTRANTTQTITIPLVKNTNNVRIVLQHLSGSAIDVNKFTFTIEDENGLMNHSNQLLPDEKLIYHAWHTDSGITKVKSSSDQTVTSIGVAIAELTVGRLVTTNKPILTIYNETGTKVLSIPLIDYALLVKGFYNRTMDDQEYLDRQDEYNMTFFLDSNNTWVSSSIIINGWKVTLDDVNLDSTKK